MSDGAKGEGRREKGEGRRENDDKATR